MTAVHNLGFNIVYLGEGKASYRLFFDGPSSQKKNNYVNIQDKKKLNFTDHDIHLIMNADHIIFARDINYRTIEISKLLKAFNISYSYYADDNFFLLKRILPNKETADFLNDAEKIILTTTNLKKFFKILSNKNDSKYILLPLDIELKRQKAERKILSSEFISLGFFGTAKEKLYLDVIKELEGNSKHLKFKIYLPKDLSTYLKKKNTFNSIIFHEIDFYYDYDCFIKKITSFNIDFLIHPADINDKNFKYKNLNSLLLPYYCRCLTLFCDSPPWNQLRDFNLSEIINNNNQFLNKIEQLYINKKIYNATLNNLSNFVENYFSSNDNLLLLSGLLSKRAKLKNESLLFKKLKQLKFSIIDREIFHLKRSIYRRKARWFGKADIFEKIDTKI